MFVTLVCHEVRVTIDWDKIFQREHPLDWKMSILKDIRAVLQDLLPRIFSWILGDKCNKCPPSIFLLYVRLDLCIISRCPCFLLSVVIDPWVVFLETRVIVGGYYYYLLLHTTILFILRLNSYHQQYHNRHSILFINYIGQWGLYFANSPMYKIGKIFCPLDDRKRLAYIWHVQCVLYISLNQYLSILFEVFDDWVPLYLGVDDGSSHCLV